MQTEKKILIIDDNELTLNILKIHLEHHGFKVATCPSAVSALALAQGSPFGIYIVDYRLPGKRGDSVTAAIRKMQPSAVIIGYCIEAKEQAFLSAGADKFILKEKLMTELSVYIREQEHFCLES